MPSSDVPALRARLVERILHLPEGRLAEVEPFLDALTCGNTTDDVASGLSTTPS